MESKSITSAVAQLVKQCNCQLKVMSNYLVLRVTAQKKFQIQLHLESSHRVPFFVASCRKHFWLTPPKQNCLVCSKP